MYNDQSSTGFRIDTASLIKNFCARSFAQKKCAEVT